MNETAQQQIVVGVSGSRASVAALRWAAEEARHRCARLSVVFAWDQSLRPAPYAARSEAQAGEEVQDGPRNAFAAAMHAAFGQARPAGMAAELAEGMPERVLIGRSATADLLVLGTARPQEEVGRPVGPVIRACLSRARCPVVVVSAGLRRATGQPADDAEPARESALAR